MEYHKSKDTPFARGVRLTLLSLTLGLSLVALWQKDALASAIYNISHRDELTQGLVGYWTFDGANTNWAANTTSDLSGQGNTGTMTNMATRTSPVIGKIGQGFLFDGVNDYVNATPIPNVTGNATVSLWLKSTTAASQSIYCFTNSGSESVDYIRTVITGGKIISSAAPNGAASAISSILVNTGAWVHVVVTKTTSDITNIYINGVLDTNVTASFNTATLSLAAMGASCTPGSFFSGSIDDVRIYNRELSVDEIKRLYLQGASLKVNVSHRDELTEGLVGYWTMDGADTHWNSNKTDDVSGNGNTGTMINMATRTAPAIGKIGQALVFDGVSSSVQAANPSPSATNIWAVSAWVKKSTANGTGNIVDKGPAGNGYTFSMGLGPCSATQFKITKYGVVDICVGTIPSDTAWHQVAVVWNGSGSFVYVDGVLNGSSGDTSNFGANVNPLNIGGPNFLAAQIDDVRVYNRVLSLDEIKRLYLMGASTKLNTSHRDELTSGLVGYWTMDGKDTNWTTNTTADASGNGNTGTITNMATRTSPAIGKIGQALRFDGVNDSVDAGNSAAYDVTNITVSAWIKSRTNGAFPPAVARDDSATNRDWDLGNGAVASTFRFAVFVSNTQVNAESGTGFSINAWHHLVGTYDGSNVRLFVDGVNTATTPQVGTLDTDPQNIFIGARNASLLWYPATIDEVRVYNRALSTDEINRLYLMGK